MLKISKNYSSAQRDFLAGPVGFSPGPHPCLHPDGNWRSTDVMGNRNSETCLWTAWKFQDLHFHCFLNMRSVMKARRKKEFWFNVIEYLIVFKLLKWPTWQHTFNIEQFNIKPNRLISASQFSFRNQNTNSFEEVKKM